MNKGSSWCTVSEKIQMTADIDEKRVVLKVHMSMGCLLLTKTGRKLSIILFKSFSENKSQIHKQSLIDFALLILLYM